MNNSTRSIRLKELHGRLSAIARELAQSNFSQCKPSCWVPAINAYSCSHCIRVCVDLAGVDKSLVAVRVEPRRLLIRGQRKPPEMLESGPKPVRVLALEIDYGPFEREILLETEIEPARASLEQKNGFLWISLPLRANS